MADRFQWLGMSEDRNTVTLKRFDGKFPNPPYANSEWLSENAPHIRRAVALDVETTGLNIATDKIIELAFRPFLYHKITGEVLKVEDPYSELQDPGAELTERVKFITGLTDEMVKGKQIDWSRVETLLSGAEIIVAHNASFDRPVMERYLPSLADKVWGCSLKQIDWEKHGHLVHRLEALSIHHGFFVDAHRALSDVNAMLYLLSFKNPRSNTVYFLELLENARRPCVIVRALKSAFETKDILRERNYTWNLKDRCWQKQIYRDTLDAEIQWLQTKVYAGPFAGEVTDISLRGTFKSS